MFRVPERVLQLMVLAFLLMSSILVLVDNEQDFHVSGLEIGSDIDGITIWHSTDSPIWINETITIKSGAVLTVESGVDINFGRGTSVIIDGSLYLGDEVGEVNISSHHGSGPGSFEGFQVNSTGQLISERMNLEEANVSITSYSNRVFIRNSTITQSNHTAILSNNATVKFFNCTYDNSSFIFNDGLSEVWSYSLIQLNMVDIHGSQAGELYIQVADNEDTIVHSRTTNTTGIVPEFLLRGFTYDINGTDTSTGTYELVVTDIPFTHYNNRSLIFNGVQPAVMQVRFSWPPEMTNIPDRFFAYEDQLMVIQSQILDRNQVGSVDLEISSPNVTYDPIFSELKLVYEDEIISNETVYLNLSDGYDERSYAIDVQVAPRNDPPIFLLPFTLLYIREDTPFVFDTVIMDEDTLLEDMYIASDDPANVTFDPVNRDFIFNFGDGTDGYFTINLTVSDDTTNITKEVDVFFTSVNYPPMIMRPLPEINIDEDSFLVVDLSEFTLNLDKGDEFSYGIRVEDLDIMSASLIGSVVNISTLQDMNGEGSILMIVTDSLNATDSEYLNISITPVNDAPVITSPHGEELSPGKVWFNVTYNDIDGDMPEFVNLVLDGVRYNMSLSSEGTLDPTIGLYYHLYLDLDMEYYLFGFECSDGEFIRSIGDFDLFVIPPEKTVQYSGYEGYLNITVFHVRTLEMSLVEFDPPAEFQRSDETSMVGFRLDGTFENINRVHVMIWLIDLDPDILGQHTRVLSVSPNGSTSIILGLDYNVNNGVLIFDLPTTEIGKNITVYSLLDPDLDTDGDGYENYADDFPEDPEEWLDTDNDGTGDNADMDDDNDGYNDTIELDAGTDPKSRFSSPVDTDGDGILDHRDEDDDGDGMPDEWENTYGFDPLDPDDGVLDTDNDGISNFDEYIGGTDPLDNLVSSDTEENRLPLWLIVVLSIILIILIGSSILIFLMANRSRRKEEEEEIEEDWSPREELDPEDAVDCPECSNIYPLQFDECPFCGEENPYNGEVE